MFIEYFTLHINIFLYRTVVQNRTDRCANFNYLRIKLNRCIFYQFLDDNFPKILLIILGDN